VSSRLRSSMVPKISFFAFQDIITSTSGILIIVVLLLGTFLGSVAPESDDSNKSIEPKLLEEKKSLVTEVARLKEMHKALSERGSEQSLDTERVRQTRDRLESEKARLEAEVRGKKLASQKRIEELSGAIESTGLAPLVSEVEALSESNEKDKKNVAKLQAEHDQLQKAVEKNEEKLAKFEAEKGKVWLQPRVQDTTKAPLILNLDSEKAQLYEFDKPENSQTWPLGSKQTVSGILDKLKQYSPKTHYLVIFIQPEGVSEANEIKSSAKDKLGFDVGWDTLEPGKILQTGPPPVFQLDEPEPLPSLPPS